MALQGLIFEKKTEKFLKRKEKRKGGPDNFRGLGNKVFHSPFLAAGAESRLLLCLVPNQITSWPTLSGKGPEPGGCGGERETLPPPMPGQFCHATSQEGGSRKKPVFSWLRPASLGQELWW